MAIYHECRLSISPISGFALFENSNQRRFSVGLLIYFLGMLFVILAIVSFHAAPVDKPVTKGVYSIQRHPMHVGEILIYISIRNRFADDIIQELVFQRF